MTGIDHIGHWAARGLIRDENSFSRRKNLGRFRHKEDATEHDDVRIRLGRLYAESKRISNIICDILHFRDLIVMRKDDRVFSFFNFPIFSMMSIPSSFYNASTQHAISIIKNNGLPRRYCFLFLIKKNPQFFFGLFQASTQLLSYGI